ncbi:MAG TPA: hypothetical protein VJU82_10920 [Acidobacteriaceae bacterium]|nr:hypothetical protein [Acidobacteriaceae bacterium]
MNTGDADLYVSALEGCWNPLDGLNLHLIATDGTSKPLSGSGLCHPLPPKPGDVYQFLRLGPGTFYGQIVKFDLADVLKKPGQYQLQVTYRPFLSHAWIERFMAREPIANLPLWTAEEPVLKSETFQVTVTP